MKRVSKECFARFCDFAESNYRLPRKSYGFSRNDKFSQNLKSARDSAICVKFAEFRRIYSNARSRSNSGGWLI
ncbi:hypothetical protein ACWIUD_03160 [Helicobacter sp. 23-1044]